ncbi:TrmH family RNA methyltransferase [Amycolatopsis alkalitolerans]|uniref:RNA methyltransferase n=1 Tax=Amycolatopsis alkalitolerans TaxID=2547244 RepID=A0A5C4LSM3_9PSEU|nr:RNA methyltransferase [Amycolatopsis alkalitolerans]TNC19834.1 RNA methyltransferase [Amycolatopsis alkalitolerans]
MEPFTQRSPRVVGARRLTRRTEREKAGRFLAEGANAVSAALERERGFVHELFVTTRAGQAYPELVTAARAAGARVSPVTDRAAASLSETVTPQGVVAVCELLDRPLEGLLAPAAQLVAILVDVADPGNAGTVIRVADAAGADAVILTGDSVDPHNGKCVRASAGSLFHLPLARARDTDAALDACRTAGLRLLGADGHAETALDQLVLDVPVAWVFGNEAHGLPAEVLESVDEGVRIPIYGRAESLNLATAAAVCLYGSAMAVRRSSGK